MKHTECKDCELSNGDCGYHFKMDGTTNFDIASLSACDKYGNCMFFKSKAKLGGDLISRSALKEVFSNYYSGYGDLATFSISRVKEIIDNAPTVEISKIEHKAYNEGFKDGVEQGIKLSEGLQGKWIPVSERLPEINKEVIVTDIETSNTYQSRYLGDGYWDCDNGPYNNRIITWMPLPEPYKGEGGAE